MGAQDTYGVVAAAAAMFYETLPSPFLCLEKIRQDLLHTLNPGDNITPWTGTRLRQLDQPKPQRYYHTLICWAGLEVKL